MDAFLLLVIVGLVIQLLRLSSRIRHVDEQLRWEIRELAHQVTALEKPYIEPQTARATVPEPSFEFPQKPAEKVGASSQAAPPSPPPMVVQPEDATQPPKLIAKSEPPALPPIPQLEPFIPGFAAVEETSERESPRDKWSDRLRKSMGGQEWEAVVGGSWLNKVGVLVLVIGVALLLGYEFTRVGPGGRVATGMAIGLTMLIGGVVVERRQGYVIFARGLMGGGWAALYFTTYAMYGVGAAKVIDNPYLATTFLVAVAVGMILHSLRYKSQTASGLAYFIAFATLGLSESTPFAVLALLPLAGSLLLLAYRFDWYKMAVFGVLATYATCASRPDTGASLSSTQALFGAYWVLFETFDLMRLRRRIAGSVLESLIAPLNALGFLGLSLVKWHRSAPMHLYAFLAAAAVLYLVSSLIHAKLRPPSSFARESNALRRVMGGGYEGPITLASALAAAAIVLGATGEWINLGLLIEGEVLFLAGYRFREAYLRQLAADVFIGFVGKVLLLDQSPDNTIRFGGRNWAAWTPITVLATAVFYGNRILRVTEGAAYSSVAAGLITLVLGYETPSQYLCLSWLIFATLLFEFGFLRRKIEFLYQSYVVGILGTSAGLLTNAFGGDAAWHRLWLPLAVCATVHYVITLHIQFDGSKRLSEAEQKYVPWVTSATATLFLAVTTWKLAPGDYLGAAWLVLGALLFEFGLRRLPPQFRQLSYFVLAAGFLNVASFHVIEAHKGSTPAEPISLAIAVLLSFALSARVFHSIPKQIPEQERTWCRDASATAGTLFALTLVWLELPAPIVALAWAAIGLCLLEVGFSFSLQSFRLLGNIVAASVVGRLFLANFTDLGDTLRISHRVLTVIPIVVSQYYVWARYRQAKVNEWERNWVRMYLYAPAILIVVLARFELGRTLAVVAWALFGLGLYRLGLARNLVDLRWQSYAIAVLAFWRSWNTNFYIPESLTGIRGRILTGAIVIGSFYCAQLLSAREAPTSGRERGLLDRHARSFYSLLASVLLAVLLFYEVSGGVLTMAWGVEGLALLGAGFPLRDRLQRWSGLFLFLVCVLKLFLYDLRQLETVNRILSFIVLGVILVAVSWMYTRFRDRIQRYL